MCLSKCKSVGLSDQVQVDLLATRRPVGRSWNYNSLSLLIGKCCTHSVLYAKLITPDGMDHGLHSFVVPIRNPTTLLPYPGVTVGDMGEKVGLNGFDNGFVMFDQYRIPRENLLNKNGDVTPEGKYVSPMKDPKKRFGASLGNLSSGRISIIGTCVEYLISAITIATRYAATRKQFGPSEDKELPVIEYQLQADFGMEVHGLSSAGKPVCSWLSRDAIQECREACGGHGYLKVSGLGDLRNNNDACCTYEGENSVLIQQTSNWLLQLWSRRDGKSQGPITSPLGSVDFLSNAQDILATKFSASTKEMAVRPETLLAAYEWLICWLLQATNDRIKSNSDSGMDAFTAKNNAQVFYARPLSITFLEHFILLKFWQKVTGNDVESSLRPVLLRLCSLYGAWRLERHLTILYQGSYLTDGLSAQLLCDGILDLCAQLKPDVIALVDAIAPPDFVLNSALGGSDGHLYKNLQAAIYRTPQVFERPSWWKDIVDWQTKSKL
uniref:Acyl-coenzyme A oxidase n=1 Tax=Timema monikensis TaxID=170555 RepID=A0A7R9EM35_9NEOP|nr:unnamed protein product [Timema monikensis]